MQVGPETAPFGGEPWKVYHEETAADFYAKLRSLDAEGGALTTRRLVVVLLLAGSLQQPEAATAAEGREDLVDRVLEELVGAANMFGDASSGAVTQRFGTAATEDAEAQEFAESLAYGSAVCAGAAVCAGSLREVLPAEVSDGGRGSVRRTGYFRDLGRVHATPFQIALDLGAAW